MRRRTGPVNDADDAAARRRSRRGVAWDTSGSAQQKSRNDAEDEDEDALHTTKHKHRSHAHRHRRKDSERDERAPSQLAAHKGRKRAHSPPGGAADELQHEPVQPVTASPPLAGDWIREGNRSPTFGSDRPTSPAGTHARSPEPVAYDLSATMSQILKNVQAAHSDVSILPQPYTVPTEVTPMETMDSPNEMAEDTEYLLNPLLTSVQVHGNVPHTTRTFDISPYFAPVNMGIVVMNAAREGATVESTGAYALIDALNNAPVTVLRRGFFKSMSPHIEARGRASSTEMDIDAIKQLYAETFDVASKTYKLPANNFPDLEIIGIYPICKDTDRHFENDFSFGDNISDAERVLNATTIEIVAQKIRHTHSRTGVVTLEGDLVGYSYNKIIITTADKDQTNDMYKTRGKLFRTDEYIIDPIVKTIQLFNNSQATFLVDLSVFGFSKSHRWLTVILTVVYTEDGRSNWLWRIFDSLYNEALPNANSEKHRIYAGVVHILVNVIVWTILFAPHDFTAFSGAKWETIAHLLEGKRAQIAAKYNTFLQKIGIVQQRQQPRDDSTPTQFSEYTEAIQYEHNPEFVLSTTPQQAPEPEAAESLPEVRIPPEIRAAQRIVQPEIRAAQRVAGPVPHETQRVLREPPRIAQAQTTVLPPRLNIISPAVIQTPQTSPILTPSSPASSIAPPGSPTRPVIISPGPTPVVFPTEHPSAVPYAHMNQIEEVEQYTPIGTPSLVIVPEIRRGAVAPPTFGSSSPPRSAVSSTVATRTAVVSRTPGIYPTPQAFTATGRLSTTRSIYADGGAWLVAKRTCARCHLPYIEAASNGMLQCWAHRDPVPVESDLPGYEIAHVRVYECCGRAFVPDLTPLLLAREYAQTRRENVAAYMSDNNISTLTADMQHMMTIQGIQGSQIQTGCVPVDHCTAEQIDLCRVRGIHGFEVQYTKELVARVWGAGPRGVKLFLDTVPQMGSMDVKSDVFVVFKKIVPQMTDAVN